VRRIVKGLVLALLTPVVIAAGFAGYAWLRTDAAMARRYTVSDPPLQLPTDASSLAHGRHLFETRGCNDCHGPGGAGRLVMDAGPVLRLVAPNITPARLAQRGYDADRIAAAIRHGVRADGTPLIFMPAEDWHDLGDDDTAALVAHLQTLPDSDHEPGPSLVRPLGRVLYVLGRFPLLPAERLDHAPRARSTPRPEATAQYGGYVAAVCAGCHGANYAGRAPIVGGTPPVANLTPAGKLAHWTEADFVRVMRTGARPDGSTLHPIMPWKAFSTMSDLELRAMWLHFRALPATPSPG
jgi:mono/diheme cytochrome c family protein